VHPAPGPIARALWLIVDTFRAPVVFDGTAKLCDSEHVMIYGSGQRQWPAAALHIDVVGKFHNRSQAVTTLIGVTAEVRGQPLVADAFKEMTLEPGGPRQATSFELKAADGADLEADAGDTVKLTLRLTRAGLRAPRLKLALAPLTPP
jgi:hypothetical protein